MRLVRRCEHRPISHIATEAGVARQTFTKWLVRYEDLGEVGPMGRSSAPHCSPTQVPQAVVDRIEDLRRTHKWTARQIHLELTREGHAISPVTVARWLRRLGISRRRDIDPNGVSNREAKRIVARYPGNLIHLYTEVGRAHSRRWRLEEARSRLSQSQGSQSCQSWWCRTGYVYLHLAVDGFSRLAQAEEPPNETVAASIGFWARAKEFFAAHGISHITRGVTENGFNLSRERILSDCADRRGQASTGPATHAQAPPQGRTV